MKKILLIAVLVSAFALPSQAISNPYLLASVNKNATFSNGVGDETVATWLHGLIENYNDTNLPTDPDLPGVGDKQDANASLSNSQEGSGGPNPTKATLTLSGLDLSYDYLVLHWGGPAGGTIQAYYLGQPFPTTSHTFVGPSKHGISWARLYGARTNVPDAGATLVLLGTAIGILGLVRRKMTK